MSLLRVTPAALLGAIALTVSSVQIAEAAKSLPIETRVQRLERMLDNRVLIQLLQRIESLQQEVRELRGQVELQTNELEAMNKRSRDLYLDTDDRLQALEGKRLSGLDELVGDEDLNESLAAVEAELDAQQEPAVSALVEPPEQQDPESEKSVYNQAYADLVNGRYSAASEGFRGLLARYPEGEMVENSRYWLGETYYVERRFEEARAQFEAIVEHSPDSPKIADAKLKLGFVLQEQGESDTARTMLQQVIEQYPDSTAALMAERRLAQGN